MTMAEFFDVGYASIEIGLFSLSIYLTIVSAYLVVAYGVGNKLGKFQFWTITFLFVTFAALVSMSTLVSIQGGMSWLEAGNSLNLAENPGIADNQGFVFRDKVADVLFEGTLVLFVLQLVGIVLSIKFMADERKT